MAVKRSLTKLLTSPSKVAHNLDWRKTSGSILSLSVCSNHIDLAVSSHPSLMDPIEKLPSIPLQIEVSGNKRVLANSVLDSIQHIADDYNVCGVVVSWPVQKEGRCGAPCGRTLYALDQIVARSDVLNPTRPVCLWDGAHNEPIEDEWGRDPGYSCPSKKTVHIASKEQYEAKNCFASDIWADFCRTHWPDLYAQQQHWKMEREQPKKQFMHSFLVEAAQHRYANVPM